MLQFLIIILCVNIDAFSYGVAYGFKKTKLRKMYIFAVTLLSTILFAVPLMVSKYVFKYFDPFICNLINGFILIFLGIYYFLQKPAGYNEKHTKNTLFCLKNDEKYNLETSKNQKNSVQNSKFIYKKFSGKEYFIESLIISVDAIFTALLSGFNSNFAIFYIFFYAFSNFFAIFLGNLLTLYTHKLLKVKLSIFSGVIFVVLGVLKFFGI